VSAPPLGSRASGPDAAPWRLARFLHATVAKLFLLAFRVRVLGTDNLPAEGGYVLAGNHMSHLDPVLLWCVTTRPTHFIARQDLFEAGFIGWLLPRLYAFPIQRASADREAIGRATTLLKAGEPVGIFPEGTRQAVGADGSKQLGEAHQGVSFIAMRADAPVVPVGIAGTDKAFPRGATFPRLARVTISFGPPVRPQDIPEGGRKERMEAMTAEIMRRIAIQRELAEKE
jgi:1-acyl-sn-glycerol-3-phosphate acyltransferase